MTRPDHIDARALGAIAYRKPAVVLLTLRNDSVGTRSANGETIATLYLRRTTSIPFPVAARLKLADGSTRDVRFPVDLWARPNTGDRIEATVAVPSRVVGARL